MGENITRPIIGIENRTAQEVFDIMVARIGATPPPQSIVVGSVEAEIASVVQSVNEWDDRTSPDDYPEHLLITSEELTLILRNFAAALVCSEVPANGN